MFYEKQKKFFNRKWQKGSGKTVVTVNKKTISALKKWQRSTICLGFLKTSYTLFFIRNVRGPQVQEISSFFTQK